MYRSGNDVVITLDGDTGLKASNQVENTISQPPRAKATKSIKRENAIKTKLTSWVTERLRGKREKYEIILSSLIFLFIQIALPAFSISNCDRVETTPSTILITCTL